MSKEGKRTFIRESDEQQIDLIDSKVGDVLRVYEEDGEFIGKWNVVEEPFINDNGIATVNAYVSK